MRHMLLLAALLVLLSAAAPAGVSATNSWMRYLLPNIPAGGYLTLRNDSASPAVLTGASSAACGSLMLHQSEEMSGTAMMMAVPSLIIPPHGAVNFAEGGYHLMCMQPKMALGETINVTLSFQDGSTLAVPMKVYGPGGPGQ